METLHTLAEPPTTVNPHAPPGIAEWLKIIGYASVVLSLFFLLFIVVALLNEEHPPDGVVAAPIAGVLSGLVMVGFATAIEKLSLIENHLRQPPAPEKASAAVAR